MTAGLPDPGFYQDPDDPTLERWWNGRTWVGQTRRAQGQPPLPVEAVPAIGTPQPPKPESTESRSGYNTAAWVGVFLCWPIAIVFNLMDNSICKAKGLPPTFAPSIAAVAVGLVLMLYYWVAGGF